jgi:hypothetical protein
MTAKKTFEEWMVEVNKVVETKVGLGTDDLPDCCYRDWYDNGVSVKSAAARAIRSAKEY